MGEYKVAKPNLLEDSSSDSEISFKINESYATKYERWREGEELQKLKDKYGSGSNLSSSSESEEEIPVIEKDFLKTLSLLKSKDPQIYNGNVEFFRKDEKLTKKTNEQKSKPLYPKDYERKRLLEQNGNWSDDSNEIKNNQPTYDEEQEDIKKSFRAALEDSNSDGDDDLLQIRQKDKAKKEQEEGDYIDWLKGEKVTENSDKDLEFLHSYWNGPNLDNDEQFLKDYILNRKFVEGNDEILTYDEITRDVGTLSDDEELLKKQETFEHKFNFRFEEPDADFIKKYPRTIGDSLRKKDTKRKLKREEYQVRKQHEKEQKKEELKRLKALKRKEIEEKLSKLREITGNAKLGFDDFDVEGDFDPNEHDKKMREVFNEEYYGIEEDDKPKFPSDEELDYENWDNGIGENGYNNEYDNYDGPHCEDPDFNMDADYDSRVEFQKQMIESSKFGKKRKKSKFAAALSKSKPVFDPSLEPFEKYFDEYYKLDYEDIIGDLPVRFKYRQVVPNNFGLTTEEILLARDKELNRWCSLKKTCQYRREEEEKYDVQAFKKKAQNFESKKKILHSLFEEPEAENEGSVVQENSEGTDKREKRSKKNVDVQSKEVQQDQNVFEKQSDSVKFVHEASVNEVGIIKGNSEETSKRKKNKLKVHSKELQQSEQSQRVCEKLNNSALFWSETNEGAKVEVPETYRHLYTELNEDETKRKHKHKKSKLLKKTDMFANGKNHQKNKSLLNKQERNKSQKAKFESTDKMLQISDARLKAYGINPKKFKNRLKYSQKRRS